jgi:hypothetical protein
MTVLGKGPGWGKKARGGKEGEKEITMPPKLLMLSTAAAGKCPCWFG